MKNTTKSDIADVCKVASVNELKKINQQSIDCDYNRNLQFDAFYKTFKKKMKKQGLWSGDSKTNVVLRPLMVHQHKGSEPCEDHMRCEVFTNNALPFLTLDVPFPSLNRLLTVNEFQQVRG